MLSKVFIDEDFDVIIIGKKSPSAYKRIIIIAAIIKALIALIFISERCNFKAFVERNISKRNNRIEIIMEMQQEAKINLATKMASKYNARTVDILNKKPKLDAPIEYFK